LPFSLFSPFSFVAPCRRATASLLSGLCPMLFLVSPDLPSRQSRFILLPPALPFLAFLASLALSSCPFPLAPLAFRWTGQWDIFCRWNFFYSYLDYYQQESTTSLSTPPFSYPHWHRVGGVFFVVIERKLYFVSEYISDSVNYGM
jgi:hypothetical protein